jgi:hypothetical protein
MQLFTRNVMMAGPPAETMGYAMDMREFAAQTTGREIGLWANVFGAPNGSMAYTVRVEGVADLGDATSQLMANPEYQQKLAAGQSMVGGPSMDTLVQPIHGEMGEMPPVGSFAVVTRASMANGKYADAVAWGVEIAQHVEQLSGVPVMFVSSVYGGFGDVGWIMSVADAAAVDAATAKINSDPDYLASVNGAGELFIPGSGHQSLTTRIA